MFKISELTFYHNDEKQTYKFTEHAFAYGANTVGKTAMTKAIDYVLGSSDPLTYQGLDNIDAIGAHLVNNQTDLWIKRTIDGCYLYKRTVNSNYTNVSCETYKDNIALIVSHDTNNHFTEVYRKVFDENPTYRSFNFLNYVEEKGLGDLSAVFTMAKELKHQIRIQKIMNFFFNYENIEKIYEKRTELEQIEAQLTTLQADYNDYVRTISQQKKLFSELQLQYSGDIEKDKKTFKCFQNNYSRKAKNETKDLVYLSQSSFSLAEEIKLYSFMNNQSANMLNRKERIKRLLSMLNSIILDSPEYSSYVDFIKNTINEINDEKIILSLTDYKKAIREIESEKVKIDEQIERIKGEATEITYEKAIKKIGLLEHTFSVLGNAVDVERIGELQKRSATLKQEIKSLRASYNKKAIDDFNKQLSILYLNEDLDIKHVIEDRGEKAFSLEFDPFRLCLFAIRNEEGHVSQYMPGSMARQTHLQMLVYLQMFAYLKTNFDGFIYAPFLIIDSANQPMGIESFNKVYPTLVSFANSIELQTIFLSKDMVNSVNSTDVIDISKGLNKFHKQTGR